MAKVILFISYLILIYMQVMYVIQIKGKLNFFVQNPYDLLFLMLVLYFNILVLIIIK